MEVVVKNSFLPKLSDFVKLELIVQNIQYLEYCPTFFVSCNLYVLQPHTHEVECLRLLYSALT